MRGWRGGVVYSRHNARFSLFRCIKNGVMFHLFWYQWHPIECLGQTNNIQSDRGCLWMGFVMLFGGWRVDRTNMGTIFISELVPHYPPQKILAINDPMLLNSGKNALTQQSTGTVERFLSLYDGHWPMWQPTTYDLVVTFSVQKHMVWIELAAGRMIEETTIYKKIRDHC